MDYEQLISEVVGSDNECGENLENDSGFQNFFFESEGTPERYDGQTTSQAEPPDWRSIKKQAIDYLKQTRDLKLISVLAQAILNTEGIVKFEQCLHGLAELVEKQWINFYPPIDEDDGDPLERISALGHLTDKAFIINTLKSIPVAHSKVLGNITLKLIDRSSDPSISKNDSDLDIAQVIGLFKDSNSEETLQIYNAVNQCITHLDTINKTFIEQAGNEYNVNFDVTTDVLTHLANTLKKYGNLKVEIVTPVNEMTDNETTIVEPSSEQSSTRGSTKNLFALNSGNLKLASRQDIERCFDLICSYYKEFEPSSPIPILIGRAKKLVNSDFLDIVKDIFPDALDQVHKLGGISTVEESNTESNTSESSW